MIPFIYIEKMYINPKYQMLDKGVIFRENTCPVRTPIPLGVGLGDTPATTLGHLDSWTNDHLHVGLLLKKWSKFIIILTAQRDGHN